MVSLTAGTAPPSGPSASPGGSNPVTAATARGLDLVSTAGAADVRTAAIARGRTR